MMLEHPRLLSVSAVGGAGLLFIGTFLHPSSADPNDALAAFTEYADDSTWVASHLLQFGGAALSVAALVLLAISARAAPRARGVATLGALSAAVSLAVAAALQAVDGVALKTMVNLWAAAPPADAAALFYAALAVRQIEIGLASMGNLAFGLSAALVGMALLLDRRFPCLLGVVGIAGGLSLTAAGVVTAYSGFSPVAMSIELSAASLLLLWLLVIGVWSLIAAPAGFQAIVTPVHGD